MEPRWNKISSAVVESLEAAIAIEQNKVILLKISKDSLIDQKLTREDGEGKVEFENRKAKMEKMLRDIPVEISSREGRVVMLMQGYEEFLKGKSILGTKTGPIEKLESLFGREPDGKSIPTA